MDLTKVVRYTNCVTDTAHTAVDMIHSFTDITLLNDGAKILQR